MAVSCFFGMTESGKSYLANNKIKKVKKSIIFDFANCFNDGTIFTNFDNDYLLKVFNAVKNKNSYCLIFKPLGTDIEKKFNKLVNLALFLGRDHKYKNGLNAERLIFLIDEIDFVCSASYQSPELKKLVNVGRHDLVDTWAIARTPQRIHTDIRDNASLICSFRLNNEVALNHLSKSIGKVASEKIKNLKKYNYLVWKDSGEVAIFSENQKIIESWS